MRPDNPYPFRQANFTNSPDPLKHARFRRLHISLWKSIKTLAPWNLLNRFPQTTHRLWAVLTRYIKQWRKLFRPIPITVIGVILLIVAGGILYLASRPDYTLTPQAALLLTKPDAALEKQISYDAPGHQYFINQKGLKPSASTTPNVLVGQPSTGLYSATVPTDLARGITVTDDIAHLNLTLKPEFKAAAVKQEKGRFVYPSGNGIQAVYTPGSTQLAEDLIINRKVNDSLSFAYKLVLPSGMKAFNAASGGVLVVSGGKALFELAAPTIRESDGQSNGQKAPASTRLTFSGGNLKLVATNLNNLTYPIVIDPSILINSSNGFLAGNNEGGIDAATNQFTEGGLTGGGMSAAWSTDTSNPLLQALNGSTSVAYNGYIYEIGGSNSSGTPQSTVYYAPINSNGSIGTWVTDSASPLPQAITAATAVAYNGYIYELGGENASSIAQSTVYYAPINSNGSLGAWVTDTASPLPQTLYSGTSVVYDDYVYEMGGYNGSVFSTVYYAPINSNGSLGAWVTDTASPLPQGILSATSVVYNGYIYEIGGNNNSVFLSSVYYAPINSNGSLGAWVTDTASPLPHTLGNASSVVTNGYIYILGGFNNSYFSSVEYASINSNGSIGAWITNTNYPLPQALDNTTAVSYNGYVYELGGNNSSYVEQSTIYYDQIAPAGYTSPYISTTSLSSVTELAASAAYNGYIYEIGGQNNTGTDYSTVYYDSITNTGGLGATWSTANALSVAVSSAAAVAYNGYLYLLGGDTSCSSTSDVCYAAINSNGALNTWGYTTNNPNLSNGLTAVAYNGYMYVLGGSGSSKVYYAPINSNGTLGSWTSTASLSQLTAYGDAVAYGGRIYIIGGGNGSGSNVVDYAVIDSTNGALDVNGPCGSVWCGTTSLPNANTQYATSIATNGYVYEFGGCDSSGCALSNVYYAAINSNGTLGSWSSNTNLPTPLDRATGVYYDGYVYEIGGNTSSSNAVATVNYAQINNGGTGTVGSWGSTGSLPVATDAANSVAYNGYVYEIGGDASGSTQSAVVNYSVLTNSGALAAPSTCAGTLTGDWCASTSTANGSLPTVIDSATSVAYNGYVYEIGGCITYTQTSCTTSSAVVNYSVLTNSGALAAPSTCAGTLTGDWCASTSTANGSLPTATNAATSVTYNGYVYEIGGNNGSSGSSTTVNYALINGNGTLGSWTATTGLPAGAYYLNANSVAYNGYVYEIGGNNGDKTTPYAHVYYAPINSNGTLGSWTATTSLPTTNAYANVVTYNGYVYEMAGTPTGYLSSLSAAVYYAPINSNGTLGSWTATTSLPAATASATSVVYNGYVYELGGGNGCVSFCSGYAYATVSYAPLNSIPHIGQYSMLVNPENGNNVTPTSIIVNGTNTGNTGNGGLSGLGGLAISYGNATTTCSTLSAPNTVDLGSQEMSVPYKFLVNADGCGNLTGVSEYIWVHFTLDDSQTASFPDVAGNHTAVTGFQIFYHPATSQRLRGGMTLQNGALGSLDAPPTTTGGSVVPSGTISAVGSWASTNGTALTTLSFTPQAVGDLVVFQAMSHAPSSNPITNVSAPGITFSKALSYYSVTTPRALDIWTGRVTATGSTTITVTWQSSISGIFDELDAQEFASSLGSLTVWSVDGNQAAGQEGTTGPATAPTLTASGSNELYYAFFVLQGTTGSGSGSGFTFSVNSDGNVMGYDTNFSGSAAPTFSIAGGSTTWQACDLLLKAT